MVLRNHTAVRLRRTSLCAGKRKIYSPSPIKKTTKPNNKSQTKKKRNPFKHGIFSWHKYYKIVINLIAELKAAHEDSSKIGINVFTGKLVDMEEAGVIEPLRIKTQAIKAASEAAEMILRIDDMIAARNALNSSGPDESGNDASGMPPMGGMPGGMGGMPPM